MKYSTSLPLPYNDNSIERQDSWDYRKQIIIWCINKWGYPESGKWNFKYYTNYDNGSKEDYHIFYFGSKDDFILFKLTWS